VAVLTTSGDALDLTSVQAYEIRARKTIVWVHGVDKPGGLHALEFDALYAVSRFIARHAVDTWGVPNEKVIVTYNGYDPSHFKEVPKEDRDPHRLIYTSHPSKGFKPALEVLRILREADARFHLIVCGGGRLWGGEETEFDLPEGSGYLGLMGQKAFARELVRSSFALQLQRREEPFGLAVAEAMRAGCIVVASNVGAFPEQIRHERDGLLIAEDALGEQAPTQAAAYIRSLTDQPEVMAMIRNEAEKAALSVDEAANQWESHWDLLIPRR
jgi:glycosyltransferase involved in cell wall biosynthesis